VGIEGVKHARDGAVVDGLVGLVGVQGLGVVLLDEGIDVGEGVKRIAEGGLVGGGLSGDLLVDQRAEHGARNKEEREREEGATCAGSHWLS